MRLGDVGVGVARLAAVWAGLRGRRAELRYTVRSATANLSLSVMDFLPASLYSGGHGPSAVWAPELVDAILAVA